jgi:hypothetical protein
MRERAILSTRNEHVDAVNALMIHRFTGDKHVYYNFDEVKDDTQNNYPLDFLNSLTPNGLPTHELTIKRIAYHFAMESRPSQWIVQCHMFDRQRTHEELY